MKDKKNVALAPASGEAASEAGENLQHLRLEPREAIFKLADGSLVRGKINLRTETHRESEDRFYKRISDLFTKGRNPFVVVYDAVVEGCPARYW